MPDTKISVFYASEGLDFMQPTDFFFFQAKDFVTAIIALGGLVIAVTNLYNAYLRRPRLVVSHDKYMYIASDKGRPDRYRCFLKIMLYNKGSEPAVLQSLRIVLRRRNDSGIEQKSTFVWKEFVEREEARASGDMHHKGIRAAYKGDAFDLIIPKTDAIRKEIVFYSDDLTTIHSGLHDLIIEGDYIAEHGRVKQFKYFFYCAYIGDGDLKRVEELIVRENGVYQYSNHHRVKLSTRTLMPGERE